MPIFLREIAAAILVCLATTCLMGEAHAAGEQYLNNFYYSGWMRACSTKNDCAYKGCADRLCTRTSPFPFNPCNNGVYEHFCDVRFH